ncbi:metalloprotease, partial [Xylariales sp. PMI_506]
ATLYQQLQVVNDAFTGTGFSFQIAGVDRVLNFQWATHQHAYVMRKNLRTGKYTDLNVFIVPEIHNLFGYISNFPQEVDTKPQIKEDDGVTMLNTILPGGQYGNRFSLGRILAHEIGHWLGLFHTFHGGCSGRGDGVDDTTPEATPGSGCPYGRRSCSGNYIDPIHNHMDYTDDYCRTQFTSGQVARMRHVWNKYRVGYA